MTPVNQNSVSSPLQKAYELTLVLRSQAGDACAFEELLRLHSKGLRCYVAHMLNDLQHNADDVMQDVWLGAFRGLPRLNDAAAFPAWLYSIARARIAREFRRHSIRFESPDCLEAAEPIEMPSEESVDSEALLQELARLSPEHREVLVLRFLRELSYDEIARITNHSVGTVRSRLHYAKRALRRAMKEKSYESK